MKQIGRILLSLFLCIFAGARAFAYDALINGIYYNFSGNNAEVTCMSCEVDEAGQPQKFKSEYSGNVVIPLSVTYNGRTYSVTNIL